MTSTRLASQLFSLLKPRIAALLCLTGASGAAAAGGLAPLPFAGFVFAGLGMAGGAAALNCWYDRDIDRKMERTADRPLARGELSSRAAFGFAVALLAAGTAIGLLAVSPVSVAYMWLGVAAYVGLYTVALKRRHWIATVLGGSAGSFPVLAGWTAVRPLEPAALVAAALVFAWTPAHAWALAQVYRDDFAAAGVPKLPVVAPLRAVRKRAFGSALVTVAVAAAILPLAGTAYAVAFVAAVPAYLLAYRQYLRSGSDATAVRAFFTSNLFLTVLFAAWGIDGMVDSVHPGAAVLAPVVFWLFVRMWTARPGLRGVPGAVGGEWRSVRAWLPTPDDPPSDPTPTTGDATPKSDGAAGDATPAPGDSGED
ncbi:heme o synthase [Halorussus litoreus]|uniref:heme o synthase n=1 Tax=Halorussus litoreus TaxID=1710536 RepID=UPI0018E4E5DF|nr:heme o synthase [Halorussus litoreus]